MGYVRIHPAERQPLALLAGTCRNTAPRQPHGPLRLCPGPLPCACLTVHPAEPGAPNAFACTVERVVDDVFAVIVLLRPAGAGAEAPLLRMELEKAAWAALPNKEALTASVAPEDLLLLK